MWKFNKKQKKSDDLDTRVSDLKQLVEIGYKFNYLGRECVVTGHSKFFPMVGNVPMLNFDYVDNDGVIHSILANVEELPALIGKELK
jgi:hypothetical protein